MERSIPDFFGPFILKSFATVTDSILRTTTYRLMCVRLIEYQGGAVEVRGTGEINVATRNPVRPFRDYLPVSLGFSYFEYLFPCHKSNREDLVAKVHFEKPFHKIEHNAISQILNPGSSFVLLNGVK